MPPKHREPQLTRDEQLDRLQEHNLKWCETWAGAMPTVEGVDICRAVTYDLIQFLNRASFEEFNREKQ